MTNSDYDALTAAERDALDASLRVAAYADGMIRRDKDAGGIYAIRADTLGWLYGMAPAPSDQINWDKEKRK